MAGEPLVEIYRFNEDGVNYDALTTIVYQYPNECTIKGIMSFSLEMRNELFAYLRAKKVSWIRYQHNGKRKMIYLGEENG
ncbi:MAG: hypothetical protein Unbinned96contig1001_30 [Prokaryotic dsDNA virus sp.]|nr:MAG: hypothetical protein Unbinned96contig1001_30 [Prokaryotic dsDNA virus sp.]|tara:strand:+ start:399 stop:638 length:240 start_codon:yes stop_codon:yes gene_type:complete